MAVGLGAAAAASIVAIWIGTSRGIDLTDEGIYLVTYRAFRHPELTFTGTPAILGPLFQLLGWSIPALRRAKLIGFIVTSGMLGFVVDRFLSQRLGGRGIADRARTIAVILLTMIGGLTVYAFLPQSPGYNDMAILLSMIAVAMTLRLMADGPRIRGSIGFGFVLILLFLVKFPSALLIGAGCVLVLFVRRRTTIPLLLRTLAIGGVVGAVCGLFVLQILSGDIVGRIKSVFRANDTAVKGQQLSESYVHVYASATGSVIRAVLPLAGVVAVVAVIGWFLLRRRPWIYALVLVGSSAFVVLVARRRAFFAGGQDNVSTLQNAFPLVTALVLIVVFSVRQTQARAVASTAEPVARRARGDLLAAAVLLLAAPTLQGIGTGNSPFAIAASAGALWVSGLLVLLFWLMPSRGPGAFAGLGMAGLVVGGAWLLGAPALWLTPFRLSGDLRDQTTAIRGVPRLAGVKTDPRTAAFLREAYDVLEKRHLLGSPGFSSFAGVGMAYALELGHPPAGMYVDEPLAAVLKGRVADACRIGAIGPDKLPVVLSDYTRFSATTSALTACGIDFPGSYDRVKLASPPFLKDFGIADISVWTPKA